MKLTLSLTARLPASPIYTNMMTFRNTWADYIQAITHFYTNRKILGKIATLSCPFLVSPRLSPCKPEHSHEPRKEFRSPERHRKILEEPRPTLSPPPSPPRHNSMITFGYKHSTRLRRWPNGQHAEVVSPRSRIKVPPDPAANFGHRRVSKISLHATLNENQLLLQQLHVKRSNGRQMGSARITPRQPLT